MGSVCYRLAARSHRKSHCGPKRAKSGLFCAISASSSSIFSPSKMNPPRIMVVVLPNPAKQ